MKKLEKEQSLEITKRLVSDAATLAGEAPSDMGPSETSAGAHHAGPAEGTGKTERKHEDQTGTTDSFLGVMSNDILPCTFLYFPRLL